MREYVELCSEVVFLIYVIRFLFRMLCSVCGSELGFTCLIWEKGGRGNRSAELESHMFTVREIERAVALHLGAQVSRGCILQSALYVIYVLKIYFY